MRYSMAGGSAFGALLVLAGCGASFDDLRPDVGSSLGSSGGGESRPDGGQIGEDGGVVAFDMGARQPDAGFADGGGGTPDAGGMPDAGGRPDQGAPEEVVLSAGDWVNRGYSATGSISVVRTVDGSLEVRTSDDFSYATQLPGPTLFLSQRASIGRSGVCAGDLELGRLSAVGAMSFDVPESAADFAYAWIYCEPFSVEMNRATLEAP